MAALLYNYICSDVQGAVSNPKSIELIFDMCKRVSAFLYCKYIYSKLIQ